MAASSPVNRSSRTLVLAPRAALGLTMDSGDPASKRPTVG
jgi:hypothetical protein